MSKRQMQGPNEKMKLATSPYCYEQRRFVEGRQNAAMVRNIEQAHLQGFKHQRWKEASAPEDSEPVHKTYAWQECM